MLNRWVLLVATFLLSSLVSAGSTVAYFYLQAEKGQPLETFLAEEEAAEEPILGSIKVCLTVMDYEKKIRTAADQSGTVVLTNKPNSNSNLIFPSASFSVPLELNQDLFNQDNHLDSQCYTYPELALGTYFYAALTSPGNSWQPPTYNDQFEVYQTKTFASYNSSPVADGSIELTPNRSKVILAIILQQKPTPSPTPLPSGSLGCYFTCLTDTECQPDQRCSLVGATKRCLHPQCPTDDSCSCKTTSTSIATNSGEMNSIIQTTQARFSQP